MNKRDDLIEALTILTKLLTNLVSLESKADAHGTERSMQSKFRTIFSENTVVNNSLLSIGGNIEDLLILMGYQTRDQGNPSLKPNFYFGSDEKEDFTRVREKYLKPLEEALQALQKSKMIEETQIKLSKRRSLYTHEDGDGAQPCEVAGEKRTEQI